MQSKSNFLRRVCPLLLLTFLCFGQSCCGLLVTGNGEVHALKLLQDQYQCILAGRLCWLIRTMGY
jgi:hypothetical protein